MASSSPLLVFSKAFCVRRYSNCETRPCATFCCTTRALSCAAVSAAASDLSRLSIALRLLPMLKSSRRNLQITVWLGQRCFLAEIPAHYLRQLQLRLRICASRTFNLRIKFASLHGRACQRAAIGQPRFVTTFLSSSIFLQPLPLLFPY